MADDQRKDTVANADPAMHEVPSPDGSSGEDKQSVAEDQLGDVADAAPRNMPGLPPNLAVDPTLGANKPRRSRWFTRFWSVR
jgi:hypothetical protein